jgi:pyridoxal biosynthesis lyase PdxS
MDPTELYGYAKDLRVPYELLKKTAELGRLPVVNFAAGGLGKQGVPFQGMFYQQQQKQKILIS